MRQILSRRDLLGALPGLALVSCRPEPSSAVAWRLPAEWEPHERCVMLFPTAQNWEGCWDGRCDWLRLARAEWAAVANAVSEFEPVLLIANEGEASIAQPLISSTIELVELPLNDAWARDVGPLVQVNDQGGRRVAGVGFNCWGEKFSPWDDDAALAQRLAQRLGLRYLAHDFVLEGGAIAVDGQGTLITTEQCLLNPNRNPGYDKAQVEAALMDILGVRKVLWLGDGLVPDPITDGHVDGIVAFVAPGVVMVHSTDDSSDPNYAICEDAISRLEQATDAEGRALEILRLPLGNSVAHMNFYIANGGVVVPLEDNTVTDEAALAVIREAFPGREVVGVAGTVIAEGGGGVHCITMQVPGV